MRLIDLPVSLVRLIGFTFLVFCLAALLCALYSGGKPKTLRFKLSGALLALLCFIPGYIVEMYSVRMNDLAEYSSPLPWWSLKILSQPVWLFALSGSLIAAAEIVLAVRLFERSRNTPSARSVCEGLDQLPDGICFSLPDGFPRLVNNRMQQISNTAFGEGVVDVTRNNEKLKAHDFLPGCSIDEEDANVFLILPDSSAWRLKQQDITVGGKPMIETIAFDVTTRYEALRELRERNARMASANSRLRKYLDDMDRIIRENEILKAKIRLHDELGNALLAIRNYLSNSEGDREELIKLLRLEALLMNRQGETERNDDPLFAVEEAAEIIGVGIHYSGELPETDRDVVTVAIHECLTNTVKHANGKNLFIDVGKEDGRTTVTLTNDGNPPKGTVVEAGGLSNLRALCESRGIGMKIESAPAFRLKLKFDFER